MVHEPIVAEAGPPRSRHGPNTYDDIDAWFDKLAGCAADDRHHEEIRGEIIRLCLPLAEHIALRYTGRGESYDDLYQVAQLGLVLAVDRFDITRGTTFLAYAIPTIMGEVRRHFRDSTWATRVPRRLKDLQTMVGPATERLAQNLERMPNARELATEMAADPAEVIQALVAANAYRSSSLDEVVADADNEHTPVGARLGVEELGARLGVEEHCYELTEDAMAVRPLIADLPRRERRILTMRFFESKTQTQIARALNISQMQVSRILTRTLRNLRERALPDPA